MDRAFLIAGIALCLFGLWAIGRHDWIRLTRPARRVMAEVTGHRSSWEDSSHTYAAIYRFSDESGSHEVIDSAYHAVARPPVGTLVELAYPQDRPDLARPPRPLLWIAVYLVFGYMLAVLCLSLAGWLD